MKTLPSGPACAVAAVALEDGAGLGVDESSRTSADGHDFDVGEPRQAQAAVGDGPDQLGADRRCLLQAGGIGVPERVLASSPRGDPRGAAASCAGAASAAMPIASPAVRAARPENRVAAVRPLTMTRRPAGSTVPTSVAVWTPEAVEFLAEDDMTDAIVGRNEGRRDEQVA